MKRMIILLLLTALLLGMAPAQTAAANIETLTALARYFPQQTVFFAAASLDDAAFSDMDTLLTYIQTHIPEAQFPTASFERLLDMALTEEAGMAGDFESLVGSWLGDTIAVGVFSFQSLMTSGQSETGPLVIAAELDDRTGAETFFGTLLRSSEYKMTREDGQMLFSPESPRNPTLLLTDEVLMVAAHESWLTSRPSATLAENEMFTTTIDALPAERYNFLVYLDYQGIVQPATSFASMDNMDVFLEVAGPQVYAFTLLDNRTLVMDVAIGYNNLAVLEDMGFHIPATLPLANMDFAARIPAQTPLVVQAADFGPMLLLQFENFRAVAPLYAEMMQQQLEQMREFMPPGEYAIASALYGTFDISKLITFINLGFAGFTGLNLEHDVLPWMQGDYALFMRPIPAKTPLGFTFDLAFVTETADMGGAQNLIVGLNEAVEAYDGVYETENVGNTQALVLPNIIPSLFPDAALQAPELDVLFSTDNDVFAAGTRDGVIFSMTPVEEESLAQDPIFTAAQRYFLEEAYQMLYLNFGGFDILLEALRAQGSGRDADDLERLLSLFESASVTSVWGGHDIGLMRATLTLAD